MLGYIVKILDKPKGMSIQHTRPHSIGDYGKVVETSSLSVQVKTAHDTMAWYLKGEVEVYSRTPVDLIIKDGKSLPANKQAVDKSISQSSSGFRNSRDLHNTYVFIKNEDEWKRAIVFYLTRGYHREKSTPEYCDKHCYLCVKDDDTLYCGLKYKDDMYTCPNHSTNITAKVLGVTGEPHQFHVGDVVQYTSGRHGEGDNNPENTDGVIVKVDKPSTDLHIVVRRPNDMENSYAASDLKFIRDQFMTEYNCHFLDSNSKPMTETTQTLEQLKFNKYVEENKDEIVALSESIDAKLEDLNDLGHTCGDLYIKVKTVAAAMSHSFNVQAKECLTGNFNNLKVYDAIFASKEYKDLVAATKALDKKIEALSGK